MRLLFLTLPLLTLAFHAVAADKPNFVLIMCDDLGWGDVGFNGGTHIRTPHLDEMAAAGMTFTRFYAQAPVCSPTRASIVTGRHHDRTGIYSANRGHLRAGEFTLYEALAEKGYATGHFGKWHMGTLTKTVRESNRGGKGNDHYSPPWDHAVDTTFATEAKTPTYDPMWKPVAAKEKKNNASFTAPSNKGWHEIPDDGKKELYGTHYWTGAEKMVDPKSEQLMGDDSTLIAKHAVSFIEANKNQPFVAIVWFHAPHLPVVASKEDAASYASSETDGFAQNYFGCVTALDRAVGQLRAALRKHGLSENTLVTFCSDNGPEGKDGAPGRQGPFKGRKRSLYEGGVRVPGLVEWPAKIKAGSVSDVTACTVDYFPTIMEIVGFEMPDQRALDGVSLLPAFTGTMTERPKPLGFHITGKAAWHDGDWKVIRNGKNADWELYDLKADAKESTNLANEHPDKVRTMTKDWQTWKTSVDASDKGADY